MQALGRGGNGGGLHRIGAGDAGQRGIQLAGCSGVKRKGLQVGAAAEVNHKQLVSVALLRQANRSDAG